MYDARSLPPEYMAPVVVDVGSLDLSRLAQTDTEADLTHVDDVLGVTIVTGADAERPETWSLRVAQDGTVNVPLVGPVQVAGADLLAAEYAIRQASVQRGVYRRPTISVTREGRRSNRVTVMGAVKEPKTYNLPITSSDLLSALVAAGGLSEQADRVIEIKHPPRQALAGGPQPTAMNLAGTTNTALASYNSRDEGLGRGRTTRVDLVAATSAAETKSHYLEDGSVVMVTTKPTEFIHVIGLVRRPNRFELPPHKQVRVLDAIAQAGGLSLPLANKVFVIRQLPGAEEPILIKTSVRAAKRDGAANIPLAASDVVSVEETPQTFALGMLRQFFSLGVGLSGRVPL